MVNPSTEQLSAPPSDAPSPFADTLSKLQTVGAIANTVFFFGESRGPLADCGCVQLHSYAPN